MALIVKETIAIHTDGGKREIQLCLGDITTLQQSDKVDLIMVSAFPGNYAPVSGTLIAALHKTFDLSVRSLASNKAEDMRKHFHCWISHELSKKLPYGRLLCFEILSPTVQNYYDNVRADLVGQIFRALFTTFSDQDRSVITPLLATGNQNMKKRLILRAMVNSCAAWMRAGLPISILKLVIYQRSPGAKLSSDDEESVQEFTKLKTKLEREIITENFTIEHDLYVSYAVHDKEKVDQFIKRLNETYKKSGQPNPKIYYHVVNLVPSPNSSTENIPAGCEDLADRSPNQLDVIKHKMLRSKRIVVFLSPDLMAVGEGVEVYNLALCLSHRMRKQLLVPVYLSVIPDLPSYMSLTQWLDCRQKDRDPQNIDKMGNCVVEVYNLLMTDALILSKSDQDVTKNRSQSISSTYDIFLSYSHRDSIIANIFLRAIKEIMPSYRIFFDRDEIKTGYSWQSTLYLSLTNSRVVIALLSPNYTESGVCREEFAIGLSQHLSKQHSTVLLPLAIESDLPTTPVHPMFSHLPIVTPKWEDDSYTDGNQGFPDLLVLAYASYVAELISHGPEKLLHQKLLINPDQTLYTTDDILIKARQSFFQQYFKIVSKDGRPSIELKSIKKAKSVVPEVPKLSQEEHVSMMSQVGIGDHIEGCAKSVKNGECQLVISYHEDDTNAVSYLIKYIQDKNPKCHILLADNVDSAAGIATVECGHVIVCMLSSTYITVPSCMHHLQVAISKNRQGSALLIPILLDNLPTRPSFVHLIPAKFASFDWHITQIASKLSRSSNQNPSVPQLPPQLLRRHNSMVSITTSVRLTLEVAALWITGHIIPSDIKEYNAPIISSLMEIDTYGFVEPKKISLIQTNFKTLDVSRKYTPALSLSADDIAKNLSQTYSPAHGVKSTNPHVESPQSTPAKRQHAPSDVSDPTPGIVHSPPFIRVTPSVSISSHTEASPSSQTPPSVNSQKSSPKKTRSIEDSSNPSPTKPV